MPRLYHDLRITELATDAHYDEDGRLCGCTANGITDEQHRAAAQEQDHADMGVVTAEIGDNGDGGDGLQLSFVLQQLAGPGVPLFAVTLTPEQAHALSSALDSAVAMRAATRKL